MSCKKILIIAGSDPSAGAGVQADLKTAFSNNVYASSVITCLTAQNTSQVTNIYYPKVEFLRWQLKTIFADIKFDAIKIGMLGTKEIISEVANNLKKYAKDIPIILDPVIAATSGDKLLKDNAIKSLINDLIPISEILTPNIDEAEILSKIKISNISDVKKAAKIIKKLGAKSVLIKGGHLNSKKIIKSILLDDKNNFHLITNKKIGQKNLHGTGCTLASAISCNIAKKYDILDATRRANRYVYQTIKNSTKIGKGSLILRH